MGDIGSKKPYSKGAAMCASTSNRKKRILLACASAFLSFGFACLKSDSVISRFDSEFDVTSTVRGGGLPITRRGGTYRVGEPYVIAGRTYTPREEPDYRAEGVASWYGDKFH